MKKYLAYILGLIVLSLILIGSFYKYKENKALSGNQYETGGSQIYKSNGSTFQKYWNEDFGISFSYKIDPEGYALIEQTPSALDSNKDIEKSISLFYKNEYEEYKKSSVPRELPRSISIRIFKNAKNLSAQEWINNNSAVANYRPSGIRPESVSFGGVSGVRYSASGLYQNEVVVLNNNYKIYIFAVEYDSPNEPIRNDFQNLLNSLVMF